MSFDTLAPHYRWMEAVLAGEKLHRCRTVFLDEIPGAHNILLAGEGHGRSLVECRRRFPAAQITCLDASAKMLTQAHRQLTRHDLSTDRTEFVHADILDWPPPKDCYDLVITNFFLDCFRPGQLQQIIPGLAQAAGSNADWLIADFQEHPTGFKRLRSRLILWSMYIFFRRVAQLPAHKLTAPDSLLEQTGFRLHRRIEAEWGLLHSDWWQR